MSLASKLRAGEARERLRQVKARTLQLQHAHTAALQQARNHRDPNLSPEGLANKRQELTAASRAKLRDDLAELRKQADADLQTVRAFVEEDRPKSAASELRQQRLWDRTRMLVDSGRPLGQVIRETDDVETLLAIRDEAPSWLRSQSKPGNDPDVTALLRSIDKRLGETAEGLPAVAAAWGLEAGAIEASLKPTLDYLELEAQGQSRDGMALHAALASRAAEQEASRGLVDDAGQGDEAAVSRGGGEAA